MYPCLRAIRVGYQHTVHDSIAQGWIVDSSSNPMVLMSIDLLSAPRPNTCCLDQLTRGFAKHHDERSVKARGIRVQTSTPARALA